MSDEHADGRSVLDAGLDRDEDGPETEGTATVEVVGKAEGSAPDAGEGGGAAPGMSPEECRAVCSTFVSQILTAYPDHLAKATGDTSFRLSQKEYSQGMTLGNAAVAVWLPDIEKYGKIVVTIALLAWMTTTMLPRMSRAKVARVKAKRRGRDRDDDADKDKDEGDEIEEAEAVERDPLDAGEDEEAGE